MLVRAYVNRKHVRKGGALVGGDYVRDFDVEAGSPAEAQELALEQLKRDEELGDLVVLRPDPPTREAIIESLVAHLEHEYNLPRQEALQQARAVVEKAQA